jgi:hypothetical protein
MITDFRAAYSFDADGKTRNDGVAAWVSAAAYSIGDKVTNAGATYYAITNHSGVVTAPGSDATNWIILDASLVGAATLAAGRINDALSVDGDNANYATVFGGAQDVTAGDFTVSFWPQQRHDLRRGPRLQFPAVVVPRHQQYGNARIPQRGRRTGDGRLLARADAGRVAAHHLDAQRVDQHRLP